VKRRVEAVGATSAQRMFQCRYYSYPLLRTKRRLSPSHEEMGVVASTDTNVRTTFARDGGYGGGVFWGRMDILPLKRNLDPGLSLADEGCSVSLSGV